MVNVGDPTEAIGSSTECVLTDVNTASMPRMEIAGVDAGALHRLDAHCAIPVRLGVSLPGQLAIWQVAGKQQQARTGFADDRAVAAEA